MATALLVCLGVLSTHAASVTWTNAAGGEWNTAGNWNPGNVPTAADMVYVTNSAATTTVNYNNVMAAGSISNLTISTLNAGVTNTLNINTNGFTINNTAASPNIGAMGVVNVNTGGVMAVGGSGIFSVAGGNGSNSGLLVLNGGTVSNITTGTFYVGKGGLGTLTINSGAFIDTSANGIRTGSDNAGSSGFINVNGGLFQTTWLRLGRTFGTSNVLNIAGGLMKVGAIELGGDGAGFINLSAGTVTNSGSFAMGRAIDPGTTTGAVVQTGGSWVQTGNIIVGYDSGGANALSYGLYTLGGGTMANASNLFLGSARFGAGQGKGFMVVTGGVWNQTGNLVEIGSAIGLLSTWTNGSVGRLDLLGGSFNATGASETLWIGRANVSTGTLNIAGGTLSVTNGTGSAVLNVGPVGQGTFLLSNGTAWVDNLVATGGTHSVVSLIGGTLNSRGTTVSNGAQFVVGNGASTAAFNLVGGTHNFGNGLQISANATLAVTSATATVAASTATNLGTVSVMNGNAIFNGNVVNLGAWVSDSSTNTINGTFTVGPTATVVAAAGDIYAFGGDLVMQSTNRAFNMSLAQVVFATNGYGIATTMPNHTLNLTNSGAVDMGSNGFMSAVQLATNFSIGTLSIALSNNLTVTGNKSGATTNALYVGWLDLTAWNTNAAALSTTLSNALTLTDINLYYDAGDARNAYLQDASYTLWGSGGLLIPIPEPGSLALMAGSLLVMGMAIRSRRKPPLS